MAQDDTPKHEGSQSDSLLQPASAEVTSKPLIASCHCGRVTVDLPYRPEDICECHCSICYQYGALWAYYKRGKVTVTVSAEPAPGVSQQSYVRTDQDGKGNIGFFRCGHCGCITHWWLMDQGKVSDDDEGKMGVNCRMLPEDLIRGVGRTIEDP